MKSETLIIIILIMTIISIALRLLKKVFKYSLYAILLAFILSGNVAVANYTAGVIAKAPTTVEGIANVPKIFKKLVTVTKVDNERVVIIDTLICKKTIHIIED